MPKPKSDLDDRGLTTRDIIEGDVLTLVGYKKKKRRRVRLPDYLAGDFPDPHMRRNMGWILPSLDGDPPHPHILAALLRTQRNQIEKQERIAKDKKLKEEASARRLAKKRAKREAWLARKAEVGA
jgi:hypothetical protein